MRELRRRLSLPGLELERRQVLPIALIVGATGNFIAWSTAPLLAIPALEPLAAAAFTLAGLYAVLSPGRQLPIAPTIVSIGTVTAIVLGVTWAVAPDYGWETWYLGGSAFLMSLLALRGRMGWAWIGMLLESASAMVWPLVVGGDAVATMAAVVVRQVAILVISTVFAYGAGRTQARIESLAAEASARELDRAARDARATERQARLVWALELARPLLTTISKGIPLAPPQRADAVLVEAELRDGLRARGLARPPITESARAARRRGVEVLLLDDRGADLPTELHADVFGMVTRELAATDSGRVVARLLPPGREHVLTILVAPPDPDATPRRTVFP